MYLYIYKCLFGLVGERNAGNKRQTHSTTNNILGRACAMWVVVYKKVCGFQPFVVFFPFHVIMAESSNVLVEHHKWAQLAITHVLGTHGSGAVLWQKHPLGFSSMFSGTCYPERALTYISAARRDVAPDSKDLSVPWSCHSF